MIKWISSRPVVFAANEAKSPDDHDMEPKPQAGRKDTCTASARHIYKKFLTDFFFLFTK